MGDSPVRYVSNCLFFLTLYNYLENMRLLLLIRLITKPFLSILYILQGSTLYLVIV